jgi:hypothetical protein
MAELKKLDCAIAGISGRFKDGDRHRSNIQRSSIYDPSLFP